MSRLFPRKLGLAHGAVEMVHGSGGKAMAQPVAERFAAALAHPQGRDAAIIGRVVEDRHRVVPMETRHGGTRIVDWLSGEPLPRIC